MTLTLPVESSPVLLRTALGSVDCAVSGEGPSVMALHGAMGGYDQSMLLARTTVGWFGYKFIAVSRPGYLGTPMSVGPRPEEQADACAAVLDELGIAKTAVIAVSGGGQCALQFALRHPRRCWGLVMVSACSAPLLGSVPFAFRLVELMARWPALLRFMRNRALRDPERALRRSIPDPETRARTLADPEASALAMALQLSTLDWLGDRLAGTRNDILQARLPFSYPLEHVSVPTLVVHGTADRMVPFAHAASLAERVPRAELVTVEQGEHACIFTHRDMVRDRVVRFLSNHAPRMTLI